MPLLPGLCDHKGCDSEDTTPRFTVSLKQIPHVRSRKRRQGDGRQPKWFCKKHRRLHPAVSPTGGERMHRTSKSYEIVDGKLVPLRGGEVYGKAQTS